MRKLIIISIFLLTSTASFSQNYFTSKFWNRLTVDTIKINQWLLYRNDTVFFPTYTNARGFQYKNAADPTDLQDLVTLNYFNNNAFIQPLDSVFWNRDAVTTGHNPYKVDIDTTNGTLRMYNDEIDIAMQMGQELWLKVKNNNGSTFDNGIIVYISGGVSGFPTVSIAHNRDFSMVDAIGMLTHDVEAGTFGFLTTYGTVGGLDTSGETEGARVYVDTLTAGKNWTTTIPEFAHFQYEIGFIHTVDPTEGKIFINPKGQIDDILHNINNANIMEDFSFISSSDGATITGTLESTDGKDYLTVRWSDGFAKIAVPTTITIPPGTDNNSQTSYIYIPKSTGVLTSSTSYFPIGTQYKTIARVNAWTPLRTQTMGLKGNQNYNDYVANTTSQRGRIAQVGNRQRWENLKYINGSFGTATVRTASAIPDTVTFAVTQGNWTQANEQVSVAMDMYIGDDIHVFNYPDHTDTVINDLNEILIDATGASITGRSWTWVFWITQNKTGEPSHMYVNLPNGSYSSGAEAEADESLFKVTDIPYEMRPYSGFVTEVTMTHTNPSGGTWVVYSTANIQGNEPGYSGGSAGGSTAGTFDLLGDTPASKAGSANKIVGVDLGEANLVYKNVTVDGSGNMTVAGWLLSDSISVTNGATIGGNLGVGGTITTEDFITKGPYVDVRAFGATGDGVTDDATAIQNAINSISHGTIFFPQGNYLINSSLTIISSDITLKSDAAWNGGTKITYTGTSNAIDIGNGTTELYRIVLDGLKIVASGSATSSASAVGIRLRNIRYHSINNVTVQGFALGHGITDINAGANFGSTGVYYNPIISECKNPFFIDANHTSIFSGFLGSAGGAGSIGLNIGTSAISTKIYSTDIESAETGISVEGDRVLLNGVRLEFNTTNNIVISVNADRTTLVYPEFYGAITEIDDSGTNTSWIKPTAINGSLPAIYTNEILMKNNFYLRGENSGGSPVNIIGFGSDDNWYIGDNGVGGDIRMHNNTGFNKDPSFPVDVNGAIRGSGYIVGTAGEAGATTFQLTNDGGNSWLNSGNFGFGTTAPNAALEIFKSITYTTIDTYPQLTIGNVAGAIGKRLNIGYDDTADIGFLQAANRGVGATGLILQRYAGNVGVGTITPLAKLAIDGGLHVGGDSDPGDNNLLVDGDADVLGGITAVEGTFTGLIDQTINTTSVYATTIINSASGGGALKLKANDGAGTILQVENSAASSVLTALANGDVSLRNGTGINEFSIDGTLAGNSDDAVPTEKAVKTYVDAQLGVSLGTTEQIPYMNPGGTDFIYTPSLIYDASEASLYTTTYRATNVASPGLYLDPTSGDTYYMVAHSAGFQLGNETDGLAIIDILNSDNSLQFTQYGSGTFTGTAAYNLEVTAAGGLIETTAGSDFRMKENFRNLNNSLDKILSIETYAFDWKKDIPKTAENTPFDIEINNDIEQRESAGVIAQEIVDIIPESVKQYNNGYYTVDYEVIVPHLIEAIKEQQKQIDELKTLMNK